MIKRTLVISDIHGCYNEFMLLLEKVNYAPTQDQLILLGDYVDRGPASKDVVKKVKELVDTCGAIALKGNHDQLFIDYCNGKFEGMEQVYLQGSGGRATLQSYESNETVKMEHVKFLDSLPCFFETEKYVFVHAGVTPHLERLEDMPEDDFLWIRDPFLNTPHAIDKIVVFGHTPTINMQETNDIYFGDRKIGIDGGCAYGFQLNGLEINEEGFKKYYVHKV